jgi:methionine-rich copper-binding protein CopC
MARRAIHPEHLVPSAAARGARPLTEALMRVLTSSLLTAAGLLSGSGIVFAHALLHTASPPVGATVQAAPPEVTLDFSEAVEPRFSTIRVEDAAGRAMDSGTVHASAGDAKRLSIALKPLPPGTYRVIWRVTSVDTHKTEGAFDFTVRP